MDPSISGLAAGGLGGLGASASGLAADSRSLEQLKRAAKDDPRLAVKKVATQFEAMFMQMVLKSMREATMRSGMLDSQEQDLYRGMLDQQIAQQVASSGTGLADMIARQLSRNLPSNAGSDPTAAPATGAVPAPAAVAPVAGQVPAARAAQAAPAAAAASMPAATPSASMVAAEKEFMQAHRSAAERAQQLTGVPASFILGQAALESGWGTREIRGPDGSPSHNLFGIKAGSGWQGRTVQATTTEVVAGVAQKSVQTFRAYDSYAAAFEDWAQSIGRSRRYAAAVAQASSFGGGGAGGFAFGMQQAGYSTDPGYGEKLARVIRTAASLGNTG